MAIHEGNLFIYNYELNKLYIPYGNIYNLLILFLILLLILFTLKKNKFALLDITHTIQLKGLAILFVVVGHLWAHVSENQPVPIFGDYAVSLFLMLSGFGLTLSLFKKPLSLNFFSRRLKKVMIPYWVVTIVILVFDYVILSKRYSATDIISTFAGINFTKDVRQLDYTRWYITLLLIYYFFFFIFNNFMNKFNAIIMLFGVGIILSILRFLKIFPIGIFEQLVAFPIGCLLAYYIDTVTNFLSDSRCYLYSYITLISITVCLSILLFLFKDVSIHSIKLKFMLIFAQYIMGITFCFLCILTVGLIRNNYVSSFLFMCGIISYEIYLIHGPLLIKYNFLFNLWPSYLIVLSFFVYLSFIIILAYFFNRLNKIYS